VLRRIADHLFWMARYMERAEWRARLADVNYHLLVQSSSNDPYPWKLLLLITGELDLFAEYFEAPTEDAVLEFFGFDARNPSSIRSCINAARENARGLRHRISSELWIEVNTLYLDALNWSPDTFQRMGVYGFFAELKERFYRIAGICQGTLPRDLAYEFLQLGTMLERAESVSRLLDVKYHFLLPHVEDVGGPIDRMQWASLLRSASAFEAYRRVYGNAITVDNVVEYLLFDPGFPRSAVFCFDRLEESLVRIAAAAGEGAPSAPDPVSEAFARALRDNHARTILNAGLHEFLLEVQDHCAAVGSMIFNRYLRFE
jgi:uncharacterized alpha-E superfamily protein